MMQKSSGDNGNGQLKSYGSAAADKESALAKCLPEITPKKPRKNGWQRPWNVSLVCAVYLFQIADKVFPFSKTLMIVSDVFAVHTCNCGRRVSRKFSSMYPVRVEACYLHC